jgi:hypothetical protein
MTLARSSQSPIGSKAEQCDNALSNNQRHLTSTKTHRTFRAAALEALIKRLLRREQDVPDDLLRRSFGNAAVPAQIFPCVDIDLSRGVSGRQFKNIFPRRGDEVSRALVSFEHPDRRE